jgi:hypothetical protein
MESKKTFSVLLSQLSNPVSCPFRAAHGARAGWTNCSPR